MFLLDTDHFVIIQDRTEPQYSSLRRRMGRYTAHDFHVSIVSFHEQIAGWNAYLNRARSADGIIRAYGMFEDVLWYVLTRNLVDFQKVPRLKVEDWTTP